MTNGELCDCPWDRGKLLEALGRPGNFFYFFGGLYFFSHFRWSGGSLGGGGRLGRLRGPLGFRV